MFLKSGRLTAGLAELQ